MASTLPTAALGRKGPQVTRLGYGTAIGSGLTDAEWERLLGAVLDSGINFIDTANDYGQSFGRPTEEQIGLHIGHRRSEYYLETKCGCSREGHVWTRENAFRGLHESLRRLKTDYIDVMLYHNPTVEEAEEGDLVTALQDMRQQGKVRWIGVSTDLPHLSTFVHWGVFDVFQIPYSVLEREHEEWITTAAETGVGTVIRGGVAGGQPGEGSGAQERWEKFDEAGLGELLDTGDTPTGFVLRYTLTHPHADTNIVGTSNLDHLRENVRGILQGPLPADVYSEAKRRMDQAGVTPASVG